jgi:ATP-dependent helicase/nuclease subunit B
MTGLWTIESHRPFLDDLAIGLMRRHGGAAFALADLVVLLPTRRACRGLRDAFLRQSEGTPMLLPRMAAIGDIDTDEIDLAAPADHADLLELPPAISSLRRQLLLAQLIRRWGERSGTAAILPGQALALARDLARLLDEIHTEKLSLDRLESLVPDTLSEHWQITIDFLAILRTHWPAILASESALDPADRRNRLIEAQIALWQSRPPEEPVIAAGFSSAVPAVADLLRSVLSLPQGMVVLPGLDRASDALAWDAIRSDATHPQHGLATLLDRLERDRESVATWFGSPAAERLGRGVLARELMRPAADSHRWRELDRLPDDATDGLIRLDLATPQEEAVTIALLLRERLEHPGGTGMLVTPDRSLARRVAAELKRWQINIDDSAGLPLGQTAPGAFLRLIADAAAQSLAPVPLLALLKHPLATLGLPPGVVRAQVRQLEKLCLRGPRPGPGIAGLRAVAATDQACLDLVDRLDAALAAFLAVIASPDTTLDEAIRLHIASAQSLAATQDGSALWIMEAGEALAGFIADFAEAAQGFEAISGADYPVLFETALGGQVVRPRFGKHPRLQILGALEARLQSADLVILGGLNEGIWPGAAEPDPFLSRPMRKSFGLTAPETLIGLAAHDFLSGFGAPTVIMTRALRAEGAPTVPSRWLLRLDTVLRAVKLERLPADPQRYSYYPMHARRLDLPASIKAADPPEPRPPVAARPRRLSVTEIGTWMRDPYAIYARHVLGLKPLDPIDADPGVAERGSFIHQALDEFLRHSPPFPSPGTPFDDLIATGRAAFGDALARPSVWAFWWPRFVRIAAWFIETETERRRNGLISFTERQGKLTLSGDGGAFELRAKADRIDLIGSTLAIIDYKTGSLPGTAEIALGFAPQLPLEAVIAASGGFVDVPAGTVTELAFWRLSGSDPAGEICAVKDPETQTAAALAGLQRLIRTFDDPATPYRARPQPQWAPRYSDYAHLARLLEWGSEASE